MMADIKTSTTFTCHLPPLVLFYTSVEERDKTCKKFSPVKTKVLSGRNKSFPGKKLLFSRQKKRKTYRATKK